MISFNCPVCRAPYESGDEMAGRKGKCGACGCKFIIPLETGMPAAVAVMDTPTKPQETPERKAPEVYVHRVVKPPPTEAELQEEARLLAEAEAAAAAKRRKRLCLVVALVLAVVGIGAYLALKKAPPELDPTNDPAFVLAPGVVADGILHQWTFDEVRDWHDSPCGPLATAPSRVLDIAGGLGLTPVGLKAGHWVSGHEGMAVQLPGKGAYLEAGRNLVPDLGGTASVAVWLRTVQDGGENSWDSPGIFGAVNENHKNGIQWGWINKDGRFGLSADKDLLACTPKTITDGKWHCVVMTRDAATGIGQMYLDGSLVDSRSGPKGKRKQPFKSLGRLESPAGEAACFAGRLDKVTVFNRVISAAEVSSFMANHAPKVWDSLTEGSASQPIVTESILTRAYDVENDPLAVRGWTLPAHGAVTYGGAGSFSYVPAAGYVGNDRFSVTVQDGKGGFRQATMKLAVIKETPGGNVPTTRFAGLAPVKVGEADISLTGWRVPRLVDWDGDGKLDLLVGAGGNVWFYRNTGSALVPAFAAGVKLQAGKTEIKSGDSNSPIAVVDMNGNKQLDLVVSAADRKLQVYLNVAPAGQPAALAAPVSVKQPDGKDFILPDRRFDLGDWDGDGKLDLITGVGSGELRLFLNAGSPADPRYGSSVSPLSGAYNLYPRLCDLNGNGQVDLVRGVNWGGLSYWLDVGARELSRGGDLSISDPAGKADLLRTIDGAIVDFADLNGDGVPDLVVGGHIGNQMLLAYGARKTVSDYLAEIEAIYNAHPDNLGAALSADKEALLGKVNEANRGIVALIQNGSPATREAVYAGLVAHIKKYPFLKYQKLDTKKFHHVPSIVLQNWVFLAYARPDTQAHRQEVAEVIGLTGIARDIFLEARLALGDNGTLNQAQLGTVRDMMRHQPCELFPDCFISFDQLYGDQRGGFVWTPNSCKNTFGCDVQLANEWDRDLTQAIEAVNGKGSASGDYFTFVMGHEVTHSMDGYVRSRANQDLVRRWGQVLCLAAGPDIVAGPNGWIDWEATKKNFKQKKWFTPPEQTWEQAWKEYWGKGPGAKFRYSSFMRGGIGIDWFLVSPQESLATQANHHWASGPGRLIGAVARFQRGVETSNLPEKANINEVVTFIDFLSVGLNRVALPKTTTVATPEKRVEWTIHLAELERDDNGQITRISVDGIVYDLTLDAKGVVIDVRCTPPLEFKAKAN